MRGVRLSTKKRLHLLQVYVRDGYRAAKPLAIEYGIAPRHIAKMARESGHFNRAIMAQRAQAALVSLMAEFKIGRSDLCRSNFRHHVRLRKTVIIRMRDLGIGHRTIANAMGLNRSTTQYWLSDEIRQKRKRRSKIARRELALAA